jgi:hypothetical protein
MFFRVEDAARLSGRTVGRVPGAPGPDDVMALRGNEAIGLEMSGDRQRFLGPPNETEAISWQ